MSIQKRFSEIHCPQCGKEFRVRKGKPRTLKQWRIALLNHLIASPKHYLLEQDKVKSQEKAESVIAKYFKSLDSTFS